MKLCINCKHYRANPHSTPSDNMDKCGRGEAVSPVTGALVPATRYCDIERRGSVLLAAQHNTCGREAKFFEPSAAYKEVA